MSIFTPGRDAKKQRAMDQAATDQKMFSADKLRNEMNRFGASAQAFTPFNSYMSQMYGTPTYDMNALGAGAVDQATLNNVYRNAFTDPAQAAAAAKPGDPNYFNADRGGLSPGDLENQYRNQMSAFWGKGADGNFRTSQPPVDASSTGWGTNVQSPGAGYVPPAPATSPQQSAFTPSPNTNFGYLPQPGATPGATRRI